MPTKAETVAALKALPEFERHVVNVVFFRNMLEGEGAQLLGVSRHQFRTALASALRKLNSRWKPKPANRIGDATASEIAAAMSKLPELERQAIQLRCYDGLDERDAAQQLGVTRNKLRTAFNLGLYNLKTQFNVVPC